MASIYDGGSSALNSMQRAIATTGHNIANVNTEGYSRQEVLLGTRTPEKLGKSKSGQESKFLISVVLTINS